jgi:hypothetical protein
VQIPSDVGLRGRRDSTHLRHAVGEQRVVLSQNYKDFEELHELIMDTQGHHPGILVVRRDNNPKRDLDERGIVRALGKLIAAGFPMADEYQVLNHWR